MRTPAALAATFQLLTAVVYLLRSRSAGRLRSSTTSLGPSGRQMVKREPVMSLTAPLEAETRRADAGSNSYVAGPAVTMTVLPVRTRTCLLYTSDAADEED